MCSWILSFMLCTAPAQRRFAEPASEQWSAALPHVRAAASSSFPQREHTCNRNHSPERGRDRGPPDRMPQLFIGASISNLAVPDLTLCRPSKPTGRAA